jgi:heterodisulfide reductase subunit D
MDKYVDIPTYPDKAGEIVYRPGCYATHIHPYIALASTRLLDLAGVDYWVQIDRPGDSTCCGMVSASQSNKRPVPEQARRNVGELKAKGAKKMLVTCPVCYKAFKNAYPTMFKDMNLEVVHITEFLNQLVKEGELVPNKVLAHNVFYHDPCHMSVGLGVDKAPRELIQSMPGTHLLNPTTDNSTCCGFSGGMRMNYPTESIRISSKEIDRVVKMGADTIITNCPGCIQNLVEANLGDERVRIVDLVEYLLEAFGETIDRSDTRTIKLINMAYKTAMPAYQEPDIPRR